ncbi:hypothetical protein ASD00_22505 [Ensifer sp. Root31]|jgi:hypothetical protein|uniref:hypothetical protein n=1 Tax=Ensifer TaxID=106591 RepID=UPI000710362B|nr:hypothetical protein [Ensifer sp. Root31]KQU94674.1 hypothetical protein ASD00_22505 [Ensifer sp. Root31]
MKFSQNGLYIESYTKCANCGVLIYENSAEDSRKKTVHAGNTYCAQECVDWKIGRDIRRGTTAA